MYMYEENISWWFEIQKIGFYKGFVSLVREEGAPLLFILFLGLLVTYNNLLLIGPPVPAMQIRIYGRIRPLRHAKWPFNSPFQYACEPSSLGLGQWSLFAKPPSRAREEKVGSWAKSDLKDEWVGPSHSWDSAGPGPALSLWVRPLIRVVKPNGHH